MNVHKTPAEGKFCDVMNMALLIYLLLQEYSRQMDDKEDIKANSYSVTKHCNKQRNYHIYIYATCNFFKIIHS
jgi:hypothetical protein